MLPNALSPLRIIFKLWNKEGSLYPMELCYLHGKICCLGYVLCLRTTLKPTNESRVRVYTSHRLPNPHWPSPSPHWTWTCSHPSRIPGPTDIVQLQSVDDDWPRLTTVLPFCECHCVRMWYWRQSSCDPEDKTFAGQLTSLSYQVNVPGITLCSDFLLGKLKHAFLY